MTDFWGHIEVTIWGWDPRAQIQRRRSYFFSWSWCSYERRPHSLRGPILPILGMPNGAIFLHGGIRCKGLCPIRQRFFFGAKPKSTALTWGLVASYAACLAFHPIAAPSTPFPAPAWGLSGCAAVWVTSSAMNRPDAIRGDSSKFPFVHRCFDL